MDCANIQRHLSEYMDGVLDAQTRALIEKHLSTCKGCQKELKSMKALVHDLENLETVKAPDDFLEQLHERMDARFDFGKFVQRLVRPFRIRIPLQIATAAAMAVLIFAIVYTPRIEKELPSAPVDKIHETMEEQEDETITASAPMEIKAEMPLEPAVQPARSKEPDLKKQEVPVTEETAATGSPQPVMEKTQPKLTRTTRPPVPMPAAVKPVPHIARLDETERIEIALLLKRSDTKETRARTYDMEAQATPVPEKTKAGTLRAAGSEKLGSVALKDKKTVDYLKEHKAAQETAVKSPRPGDESDTWVMSPYEARKQIEALITNIKGTILNIDYKEGTDMPKSIDAEIPVNQYIYFYSELRQVGTVQSPLPTISVQGTDPIRIHIRFVVE